MNIGCLYVCVPLTCQKKVLDLQELGLKMVMSHHVGVVGPIQEQRVLLATEPSLQPSTSTSMTRSHVAQTDLELTMQQRRP